MISWLMARALNWGDINPIAARGLLPLMSIYLGIQYWISGSVILSFDIHLAMSSTVGYYTIRLDPTASKMCTIIFPWGKYSYERLSMGFGGSADIFQAQIMDLMASLEFVRAYMDNLLIITRGVLDEYLQKMETVLTRLRDAGLNINAAKSSFCIRSCIMSLTTLIFC